MLERERLCVGCYKLYNIQSLMKIKKYNDGFILNPKFYLDGRSVYLCYDYQCINKAKKYGKVEKSLRSKSKVNPDFWGQVDLELNKKKDFFSKELEGK